MRIEFERRGFDGVVEVERGVNDRPSALGCPDWAHGFLPGFASGHGR